MPLFSLADRRPSTPTEGEYWLAPSATLIGDVRLGRDVGIWFGAVLRADNESIIIGAGSNVQDNCVFHADPGRPIRVGEYCTIGHGAIVHGCTVGDNSLIGMGTTILNGAVIGHHCLIAANALVPENAVIADYSLVRGVPGKVAGSINDAQVLIIDESARSYIRAWQHYRSELVIL